MVTSLINVAIAKRLAGKNQASGIWDAIPRDGKIPGYIINRFNGQRINLSWDAEAFFQLEGREKSAEVQSDSEATSIYSLYTSDDEGLGYVLSVNRNTLNVRLISCADSGKGPFFINQYVTKKPEQLVYVNVNKNDYKVISFKTDDSADTINTFRHKNFTGLLIAGSFTPGMEIFNGVLKDKKSGEFVRCVVLYEKDGDVITNMTPINGRKQGSKFAELDSKYHGGSKFKVRYNSINVEDAEFLTTITLEYNEEFGLRVLSGDLTMTGDMSMTPILTGSVVELLPSEAKDLIENGTKDDWIKYLNVAISAISDAQGAAVRAITLSGFDIPRAAIHAVKDLVYVFRKDNDKGRLITIKSR